MKSHFYLWYATRYLANTHTHTRTETFKPNPMNGARLHATPTTEMASAIMSHSHVRSESMANVRYFLFFCAQYRWLQRQPNDISNRMAIFCSRDSFWRSVNCMQSTQYRGDGVETSLHMWMVSMTAKCDSRHCSANCTSTESFLWLNVWYCPHRIGTTAILGQHKDSTHTMTCNDGLLLFKRWMILWFTDCNLI